MSNFQFLLPEFRALHEPAAGAEQLVQSDPRAAAMRARHALEQVVLWLYDSDSSLRMPYDQALNTLLTQQAVTNQQLLTISGQISGVPAMSTQVAELKVRVDQHDQDIRELKQLREVKR